MLVKVSHLTFVITVRNYILSKISRSTVYRDFSSIATYIDKDTYSCIGPNISSILPI